MATPRSGATKLVDEWAACERSHGRAQTDPTIDAHGVINIAVPRVLPGRVASAPRITGGPETPTGTCSTYLAAAQRELRATHRVAPAPSAAMYLKYVSCMRANGVPKYPYPEANDPSKTDFIGSGVDPTSPAVLKVNDLCGAKLGLPAWWVKGYGSPGDISVRSSGLNGVPPRCAFAKNGCGAVGARLPGL